MTSRARQTGRFLRYWFGPAKLWPGWLLLAGLLAWTFGPLALDLLRLLPPVVGKVAGQAILVGGIALGIARLLVIRPGDPSFLPVADPAWVPTRDGVLWLVRIAAAALVIPLLWHPDGLGFRDWDFYLDKYEAIRQSVLIWGQFPWWNPWCRAGFPLEGEPQLAIVSVATPWVLAFGTSIGLRLATATCLVLAVEGAFRLARLWTGESWSAGVVSIIYGLNGGVVVATANGYYIPMSLPFLPWLLLHAFRLGERRRDALALGAWAAFGVLNGNHYLVAYAFFVTAAVSIRVARSRGSMAPRVFLHGLIVVGVFLALAGWRLAAMGDVMADFPHDGWGWADWIDDFFNCVIRRPSRESLAAIPDHVVYIFYERSCYLGPIVVALSLASLRTGWRWWHTLALLGFALAIGSTEWYHPSYWLRNWPIFRSMHIVYRWKLVAALGVGLAVADLVARWRRSEHPWNRRGAIAIVLLVAADYLVLNAQFLPLSFSTRPDAGLFPSPSIRGEPVVQLGEGLGFAYQLRGYGTVRGFENLLGYRRDTPTLRRWRGHPDYRGEAWTADGPVEPAEWSPNRIVYAIAPGQELEVNQNPGSWWLVNGERIFRDWRCAEPMRPFVVRADGRGRVELTIRPPTLILGYGLHAAGLAILAGGWLVSRRTGSARAGRPPEDLPTCPPSAPTPW